MDMKEFEEQVRVLPFEHLVVLICGIALVFYFIGALCGFLLGLFVH